MATQDSASERDASTPEVPKLVNLANAQRKQFAAEAIERAALELFEVEPIERIAVNRIAEAAGVSVRSFYRYFASKEEILLALPTRKAQMIATATAARPVTETGFAAIRAAISDLTEDEDADLRRWQRAVAAARAGERMTHQVVAVTSPILVRALALRTGMGPDELWPDLAGVVVATALVVGARRWATNGGSLRTHILDSIDLAGQGLGSPPQPISPVVIRQTPTL